MLIYFQILFLNIDLTVFSTIALYINEYILSTSIMNDLKSRCLDSWFLYSIRLRMLLVMLLKLGARKISCSLQKCSLCNVSMLIFCKHKWLKFSKVCSLQLSTLLGILHPIMQCATPSISSVMKIRISAISCSHSVFTKYCN